MSMIITGVLVFGIIAFVGFWARRNKNLLVNPAHPEVIVLKPIPTVHPAIMRGSLAIVADCSIGT
jgi:hypothetical protein